MNRGLCMYRCRNKPGSYECVCPRGFHVASDGRHCKGIVNACSFVCFCSELRSLSMIPQQHGTLFADKITFNTLEIGSFVLAAVIAMNKSCLFYLKEICHVLIG